MQRSAEGQRRLNVSVAPMNTLTAHLISHFLINTLFHPLDLRLDFHKAVDHLYHWDGLLR